MRKAFGTERCRRLVLFDKIRVFSGFFLPAGKLELALRASLAGSGTMRHRKNL